MAEQESAGQAERDCPLVVTIFNQKGGIGKTTTSVNLAVALAALGQRVAVVDLDSQSNATSSLGMTAPPASGSYRLVSGVGTLADSMMATAFPGLWLCPASDELVGADIELAMAEEPQLHLRKAIHDQPAAIDVVLIDCPPALGMLPVNALVASDLALLPVSPEPLAREGLLKAWRHIHRIRANLNQSLTVLGVLLTMVDKTPVHREFSATVRAEFGTRVLPVVVPRDTTVLAASAQEMPVTVFDPDSPSAKAYVELGHMLLLACRRRRAQGMQDLREEDAPDLPDWLKEHAGALDRDAVKAVLMRWREEVVRNAPPPSDIPAARDDAAPASYTSDEAPPARSGGRLLPLLAGLLLGFALGMGFPAMLPVLRQMMP